MSPLPPTPAPPPAPPIRPVPPALTAWRDPRRWPAHLVNGLSVALGIGLIQGLGGLIGGPTVALLMSGGAVCTSLPDTPNAPQRTWRRVLPAAGVVTTVTLATTLLRGQAHGVAALALLIAVIGALTQLAMAWGLRAGAVGFAATLSLVFALAGHGPGQPLDAVVHTGWTLAGALLYAGWAQVVSHGLRRRYRSLAVAEALRAAATRLHSRAQRIASAHPDDDDTLRASIQDDVSLAETLQAARDRVFAARPSPQARRLTDLVLRLIELRDLLLASRLDLALLGDDAAARRWREAIAASLRPAADALQALADAVAGHGPLPRLDALALQQRLQHDLAQVPVPDDDPRLSLLRTLGHRIGQLGIEVEALIERTGGPDRPSPLSPAELQHFVSPEGWPLAALRPHLNLRSPVLRHALRTALATSAAWLLAQALPWATHPYWLVLSVAVVLRGNLEQTLARRNQRLSGTVIGCLLTAGLLALHQPGWLPWIFLGAVGAAHAHVNHRYRVTATAATLLALLQPVMMDPGSHPALGERLADTAIGALLAWAACFVLPSWERRSLQRQIDGLQQALARHAVAVTAWPTEAGAQLALRLSRAQAYGALGQLAASAQRGRAEPRWARVPEASFEAVLSHGYTLMALLGTVQHTLARQGLRVQATPVRQALDETAQACAVALTTGSPGATEAEARAESGPQPQSQSQSESATLADPRPAEPAGGRIDVATTADPGDPADPTDSSTAATWPARDGTIALTPWVLRRLRLCRAEAQALGHAARRLTHDALSAGPAGPT
ncbi:MAG: hypothetical protein RLY78_519 [Pseudomonadota bacterium]